MHKLNVNLITVGTRHRKTFGDIDGLAASIADVGLLHPVVINTSDELIVGERRLIAVKRLGLAEIDVIVAVTLDDVAKALQAERDENTCRLAFAPTEAVSMATALEPFEKAAADERMKAGVGPSENFSEGSKGESRAKVATAVGMSAPTLTKAKAVVAAAAANPDVYGDIAARMDKTGKVDPAYRALATKAAEPESPQVELPIAVKPRPQKSEQKQEQPSSLGDDFETLSPKQKRDRLNAVDPLLAKHAKKKAADAAKSVRRTLDRLGKLIADSSPSLPDLRKAFDSLRTSVGLLLDAPQSGESNGQ